MAISEDTGNQPVAVHNAGASPATTASFSPQAGTLLVAMTAMNGPSGTPVTATISDSLSGTWTLLKRQNTSTSMGGSAEIWCRYLSSAPGSMTVTSTWTGGDTGGSLVVRNLLGASSTQNGATAGAGGASIAPNTSITPTQIGSWVYGALLDWTAATTMVANGITTIIDQFNDGTNGDTYAALKATSSTSSLSPTTYGCTNVNAAFNLAFAEIIAAIIPEPAPFGQLFIPNTSPLSGLQPWGGAPDSDHSVIAQAGTASVTFLSPATRPFLLLALSSESGPGATAITRDDPYASPPPLLTPDDVTGGMTPWAGAPDSIAAAPSTTATAGVASVTFTGLDVLSGIGALPGTGSVTLTAQAPLSGLGALPGTGAVTLTAQTPLPGLGTLPGAGSVTFSALSGTTVSTEGTYDPSPVLFLPDDVTGGMQPWAGAPDNLAPGATTATAGVAAFTFTAQGPSAGLTTVPGTGTVSLTAPAPAAGIGALPGTASVTTSVPQEITGLSVLPGTGTVTFTGQNAAASTLEDPQSLPVQLLTPDDVTGGMAPWTGAPQGIVTGDATVLAGVATISLTAQGPAVALAVGTGTGTVTLTAQNPSVAFSGTATPGTATVTMTARSASTALAVAPGTATVAVSARTPAPGLGALPGTAMIGITSYDPTVTVPQSAHGRTISGREPLTTSSGREYTNLVTGREPSAGFKGKEPVSSASGEEPDETISGREG